MTYPISAEPFDRKVSGCRSFFLALHSNPLKMSDCELSIPTRSLLRPHMLSSPAPNQPPPDGAPPPHYQPVAGTSSLSTALSLSETRALSSFLSVGRVLDFDEWLTFTHGGALDWDLKSEVPPLGTQVEKHGNLGVWILGDKEPPLLKLSHIKLLCVPPPRRFP